MPMVVISLVEGRSAPQKSAIARRVCEAIAEEGDCRPEDVWIVFQDVKAADWHIGPKSVSELFDPADR